MEKASISAFIVCCNEERQIRRCIESIKWCDEIIIVDSGSTDKTLDICREYTQNIYYKEWAGYVEQKRFALEKCKNEWVLNVDADEVLTPELTNEIQNELKTSDLDGYYLLRTVYHLGKWWVKGGWHPEYRLRLCRRLKTTWAGMDPHEKAVVEGKTKKLKGSLQHYSYSNLADQISRINKYSSTLARNLYEQGERSSISKIVLNPMLRFMKFYFFKKGFLEGLPGFAMAITDSFYVFLKYLKLWEIQKIE
jgi:glycosyltransferase involved in cell wall biosynthesis